MKLRRLGEESGFTIVELILACVIFPIIVIGISNGYDAIRKSYTVARQLNEIYTVLSACPEIDRALEYDSITGSTNCYPNNTFVAEGTSGLTYSYAPTLSVTDTSALSSSDPLRTVPDSKVVNISVAFKENPTNPLQLRILITRGGIGQQ